MFWTSVLELTKLDIVCHEHATVTDLVTVFRYGFVYYIKYEKMYTNSKNAIRLTLD